MERGRTYLGSPGYIEVVTRADIQLFQFRSIPVEIWCVQQIRTQIDEMSEKKVKVRYNNIFKASDLLIF